MNIGEILIWESSNVLLLIPVVIGLVMLVRWFPGRAVFHGAGLASALWPSAQESLHAAPLAPVCRVALGLGVNWLLPSGSTSHCPDWAGLWARLILSVFCLNGQTLV
jgi:hypothetical protein